MTTAAIAILVTIAGIVSAALVAGIGAVWRLGSKVGGFSTRLEGFIKDRETDQAEHEGFHLRLDDHEGRLKAIETRCEERREQSKRFEVPPGDDGGVPSPVCR